MGAFRARHYRAARSEWLRGLVLGRELGPPSRRHRVSHDLRLAAAAQRERAEPFQAELAGLAETADLDGELHRLARRYLATVMQPPVLQLRRLVIGASHQLPGLAGEYYRRAPERTIQALAETFARLADRGLLAIADPPAAAAQFAFLVLGRALDKSLFCGDEPFSDAELTAQADSGASAFLAAYAAAPDEPGPPA